VRIQQRSTSDLLSHLLKWSFVVWTCIPENDHVSCCCSWLLNWFWLIPTYTIISCNKFSSAAFAISLLHHWLFINITLSFYFIQSNAILAKNTFECWQWFCHFLKRKSAIIFPISAMAFLHPIHWQISDNVRLCTATECQLYSLMSLGLNAVIIAVTQDYSSCKTSQPAAKTHHSQKASNFVIFLHP